MKTPRDERRARPRPLRMRAARAAAAAALLALVACAPEPAAAPQGGGAGPSAASDTPAPPASSTTPTPAASSTPAAPATPSDVMTAARSSFDACYARARSADPRLGRTSVEITFTIDKTGAPTTVDLKYRNRFDDAAKDCMRDAALALHFPPSMEGTRSGTIAFAPPSP